jgi:hypothetical protein
MSAVASGEEFLEMWDAVLTVSSSHAILSVLVPCFTLNSEGSE